MKIEKLVFWSGIYNIGLVLTCLSPRIYRDMMGMNFTDPVSVRLICAFLVFTVAVLLLSSRNLKATASIVYWEGILRVLAGLILIPAGFLGSLGIMAGVTGVVDLAWALVYFFGLTNAFKISHWHLISGKAIA